MKFDIFISFKSTDNNRATTDAEYADALYQKLVSHGYKVFFSEESITILGNSD